MQVQKEFDAGSPMHESVIKKGLKELNSSLQFDVGGRLGIYHPRIGEWQGVFYNEKHIGGMDRGTCPEYTVYGTDKNGRVVKLVKVGWRLVFHNLAKAGIPGINWDTLSKKFGVEYKDFRGLGDDVPVPQAEQGDL